MSRRLARGSVVRRLDADLVEVVVERVPQAVDPFRKAGVLVVRLARAERTAYLKGRDSACRAWPVASAVATSAERNERGVGGAEVVGSPVGWQVDGVGEALASRRRSSRRG